MGAPKTGLDLGGSKEYLKRRRERRQQLFGPNPGGDPANAAKRYLESYRMADEDHDMEGEIEAEEIFRKFQGKRTADEAAAALAKKKRKD